MRGLRNNRRTRYRSRRHFITHRVDVRLQAGVVQRCSIDVIHAAYPGLLEDKETRDLHFVVVASLRQRESDKECAAQLTGYDTQKRYIYIMASTCM